MKRLKVVYNGNMARKWLFTIGHSDRSAEQFLELLKAHGISQIVDVRTIPGSRHNPQFDQAVLSRFLEDHGIHYEHLRELGGLRHVRKDSANLGWENASFRGFADYMGTDDFKAGLNRLKRIARQRKAAMMCAEAVSWRCHRLLIADALVKEKWQVFHIQSRKSARPHELTPFLRMRGGRIIYPAAETASQTS